MNKTYDAVAAMREAREKLAEEWSDKPREQEIEALRQKYAHLMKKKRGQS